MAYYSAVDNSPSKFLSGVGFQFSLKKLPGVSYYCQSATVPSLNLAVACPIFFILAMYFSPFLIIIICYCFYSGVTFDINAQDQGFQIWALIISFTIFIFRLIKKSPSKVNLSLENKQKEILTIILESFKGIKSITTYEVTKILNKGETEIDFPKFSATNPAKVAYFLPEGIAYGSDKNFDLLDLRKKIQSICHHANFDMPWNILIMQKYQN